MPETTIDQKKFTLTWKVAVPIMAGLLIISNTFTLQIQEIKQNAIDLTKVEEAGRRRLNNALIKLAKENEIIRLNDKLKECGK